MQSSYFAVLAQHSAWANRRLYQACETLSASEYLRERGAGGGSLHAVLNHGLATDRIWIARLENRAPPALDEGQILYPDLVALKVARLAEDERLRHLVGGLSAAALEEPLSYQDRRGDRFALPRPLVLAQVFEQQARRRGAALALLRQSGASPSCLDIVAFLRQRDAPPAG